MRILPWLLACVLSAPAASVARADQWVTFVVADCLALKDFRYREHLSIRVFPSNGGGGQLWSDDPSGPLSLRSLSARPVSCTVNGREIRFETLDHRPARPAGACGLCEQSGFRLTADGRTLWETPAPAVRGDPIFHGSIDVDRDMARVCTQHRPEDLGVTLQLPAGVSHDWPPPTILACKTYGY